MQIVLRSTGWMHTPGVVRWAVHHHRFAKGADRAHLRQVLVSMFPADFNATRRRLVVDKLLASTPAELEAMINDNSGIVTITI